MGRIYLAEMKAVSGIFSLLCCNFVFLVMSELQIEVAKEYS